jgi:hypothetical protein
LGQLFRLKQSTFIREVERKLRILLIERELGPLSKEEETMLQMLVKKKKEWLDAEESKCHKKSRVVWIHKGDNNKKFFHKFTRFRRMISSVWEIKDREG